jgi:hypothetical protein
MHVRMVVFVVPAAKGPEIFRRNMVSFSQGCLFQGDKCFHIFPVNRQAFHVFSSETDIMPPYYAFRIPNGLLCLSHSDFLPVFVKQGTLAIHICEIVQCVGLTFQEPAYQNNLWHL